MEATGRRRVTAHHRAARRRRRRLAALARRSLPPPSRRPPLPRWPRAAGPGSPRSSTTPGRGDSADGRVGKRGQGRRYTSLVVLGTSRPSGRLRWRKQVGLRENSRARKVSADDVHVRAIVCVSRTPLVVGLTNGSRAALAKHRSVQYRHCERQTTSLTDTFVHGLHAADHLYTAQGEPRSGMEAPSVSMCWSVHEKAGGCKLGWPYTVILPRRYCHQSALACAAAG